MWINSPTSRIIGGQSAKSAIPWQAHLYFNNHPKCGATIIDEETVLTTANCVLKSSLSPELLDKAFLEIEAGVVSHGDATAQTRGISQIISMTSLLTHTVTYSTRASFRLKISN